MAGNLRFLGDDLFSVKILQKIVIFTKESNQFLLKRECFLLITEVHEKSLVAESQREIDFAK